jgi:hypothetical protein
VYVCIVSASIVIGKGAEAQRDNPTPLAGFAQMRWKDFADISGYSGKKLSFA